MERKTLQSIALSYLQERGWNVIPLGQDKRPLVSWKEWTTKKQCLDDVKELFRESNRKICGIGVIVGEVSNLSVVDVDVDSEGKVGKVSDLPMTLIAKTPSGGWHYYYQYSGVDKAHDVSKSDGTGRDYKHSGGYVVAPPSHMTYEKHGKIISGDYFFTVDEQTPIETFPSHLRPQNTEKKGGLIAKNTEGVSDSIRDNAIKLFEQGTREGGRNNALYTIVHEFAQDYRPSHKDILYKMVAEWNNKKVFPSIIKEEFDATFESAWNAAQVKRANLPEPKKANEAQVKEQQKLEAERKTFSVPPTLVKASVSDLSWLGDGTKTYPHYETGIEWFDKFSRGLQSTTILTAPSNTGKTLLALQIAKSVSGKMKQPVLYVDFEQGAKALYGRMVTMGTKYDTEDLLVRGKELLREPEFQAHVKQASRDMERVWITNLSECENLADITAYIDNWASQVQGEPLIVLDQIRGMSLFTGRDNLFEQTRMIADWLQDTPRDHGWTVLAVSPQNKRDDNEGEINAITGSSDLGYAVDAVISLRKKREVEEGDDNGYGSGLTVYGSKKKKLKPWDKRSVTMEFAKSRTPRSGIEKNLFITGDGLDPNDEQVTAEEAQEMFNKERYGL